MPDLTALPVLADQAPLASSGIRLSSLSEGTILQVIAGPAAPDQTARVERLAGEAGLAARTLSPCQWLLIGDQPTTHADRKRLLAALEPLASGIDQSHGRVRMRLEGPMAVNVLSKGTGVDLDPEAFPPGKSVVTLIGHVSAHLTRLDVEDFEISVLRGFAQAVWGDLSRMSEEYM
ncbi:sarcosine oxidase subunit gamma family protein [Shinella sp. G-2]|uniref:sarcosine oxidase subunit gamma family protein n=1 Tax=Shinella sp. G-2 TaxID=3133141 RepID=UPI003D037935